MPSKETVMEEVARIQDIDVDAALDPAEAEGVYRDSRQCAALALAGGQGGVLLSPPTPRPKKG
ncbi:hypothetical protein [Streptomyces fumanus]|uniref:Uncharacterized protein n=1 Tax=Streptomyces fumanus TaxID=67302 RepID=A0A919ACY8_9ACTN|nr:hypothetical protein [Streptomyces fumanus]GHE99921.1 hypothetical protein GCM10018772_25490 [Streptomyces fumanus]